MNMDPSASQDLDYDLPVGKRREILVNNEFQSDVTFLVGEQKKPIYAHKLFLMVGSEYFNKMFNGGFSESNSKEINAMDIEPDLFLEILRFIYCGEVNLVSTNAVELYIHAQKYMLTELLAKVVAFFNEAVDSKNLLSLFGQNRAYEIPFINEKCLNMLSENPLHYFDHEDFLTMDMKSIELIFSYHQMNCSETQLLEALQLWQKIHEDVNVDQIRHSLLKLKRIPNCAILRFFGSPTRLMLDDATFIFRLNVESMTLYGIGIFIDSSLMKIPLTVNVGIAENDFIIRDHQFNLKINATSHQLNIVDLFFEKIELKSSNEYGIVVTSIQLPDVPMFGIHAPKCVYDFLNITSGNSIINNLFFKS